MIDRSSELLSLFRQRLEELSAEYRVCTSEALLPDFLRRMALAEDFNRVVIGGRGLPAGIVEALEGVADILSADQSAQAAAGITGMDAVIADTGTLVIASRQAGDRRASLVPPIHIASIFGAPIYGSLEEFLATADPLLSYKLITGPSRTADIEKTLVLGMHGPLRLIVIGPETSPGSGDFSRRTSVEAEF